MISWVVPALNKEKAGLFFLSWEMTVLHEVISSGFRPRGNTRLVIRGDLVAGVVVNDCIIVRSKSDACVLINRSGRPDSAVPIMDTVAFPERNAGREAADGGLRMAIGWLPLLGVLTTVNGFPGLSAFRSGPPLFVRYGDGARSCAKTS